MDIPGASGVIQAYVKGQNLAWLGPQKTRKTTSIKVRTSMIQRHGRPFKRTSVRKTILADTLVPTLVALTMNCWLSRCFNKSPLPLLTSSSPHKHSDLTSVCEVVALRLEDASTNTVQFRALDRNNSLDFLNCVIQIGDRMTSDRHDSSHSASHLKLPNTIL